MKKSIRIILSVVLAFTVCVSFSAVPAAATDKCSDSKLNLLCFGDSTANGFALEGFGENGKTERLKKYSDQEYATGGLHDLSKKSYIALLRDEYTDGSDRHFKNLCFEAQRPTDVRAFINEEYAAKVLTYENENTPNHSSYLSCRLFDPVEGQLVSMKYNQYKIFNPSCTKKKLNKNGPVYKAFYNEYHSMVQRYTNIKSCYTKAVKNADVIVLDGVMSNLLNYQTNLLVAIISGSDYGSYSNTLADVSDMPAALKAKIKEFSKYVTSKLDDAGLPASTLKKITDALLYSYATACIDIKEVSKEIKELNPDVKIIVTGPSNILDDFHVNYNGVSINVGSICDVYLNGVSSYLKCTAKTGLYSYVEFTDNYDTIMAELERAGDSSTLKESDPYLSSQILSTLKDRITEEMRDDDDVKTLYEALSAAEPDEAQTAIRNKVLDIVIDSSHFKAGYDFSLMEPTMAETDTEEMFKELSEAAINSTEVSDELDAFAFYHVFAKMGKGAGIHPSIQGSQDKFSAVSKKIETLKKEGITLSRTYLAKAKVLAAAAKSSKKSCIVAKNVKTLKSKLDTEGNMRVYIRLSATTEKNVEKALKYIKAAEKYLDEK